MCGFWFWHFELWFSSMFFLQYILIFTLGLFFGSFLNMLAYRLPIDLKLLKKPRSFCPYCKKKLKFYELIPVVSFFILKAKCSNCKQPISCQYPAVELATGIFFVFVLFSFQPAVFEVVFVLKFTMYLIFTAVLILIFIIDLKHFLILDVIVYPLILVAFIGNWWLAGWDYEAALKLIIAALIGFVFFALQYYFSKGKWVGAGDMKFAALLGVMLGIKGLLLCLFLAYVGGAVIAVSLMVCKKMKMKSQLPMAAFLAPAAWVALIYGSKIIEWYLRNLLI